MKEYTEYQHWFSSGAQPPQRGIDEVRYRQPRYRHGLARAYDLYATKSHPALHPLFMAIDRWRMRNRQGRALTTVMAACARQDLRSWKLDQVGRVELERIKYVEQEPT